MATAVQSIFLSPYGTKIKKEALTGGVVTPGNLLIRTGATVVVQPGSDVAVTAANNEILVADKAISDGGATDTAYASGDNCQFRSPCRGEVVNLILATSQTIAVGAELATGAGGQVKAPAVAGTAVRFTALEAVTTTAAVAFIKAEVL